MHYSSGATYMLTEKDARVVYNRVLRITGHQELVMKKMCLIIKYTVLDIVSKLLSPAAKDYTCNNRCVINTLNGMDILTRFIDDPKFHTVNIIIISISNHF